MHKKTISFLFVLFLIFSSISVSAYDISDEEKVIQVVKQRGYTIPGVSASMRDLTGFKYRHPEIFWTDMIWQGNTDTVCITYPMDQSSKKSSADAEKIKPESEKDQKIYPQNFK